MYWHGSEAIDVALVEFNHIAHIHGEPGSSWHHCGLAIPCFGEDRRACRVIRTRAACLPGPGLIGSWPAPEPQLLSRSPPPVSGCPSVVTATSPWRRTQASAPLWPSIRLHPARQAPSPAVVARPMGWNSPRTERETAPEARSPAACGDEPGRILAGVAAIVSWLLRLIDTIDVPRRGVAPLARLSASATAGMLGKTFCSFGAETGGGEAAADSSITISTGIMATKAGSVRPKNPIVETAQ